ncbi:HipA family kinase [Rubrivirga litoralis]|uniref:HipA-like kinase domain-containing protein n=1 Tax=Rubrivirga litoralis TaxID=3075598 RepID=A0ABU3BMR6_9BACT|nr:HipA family kinase [Rubrivirga sp. F394]MDT0630530.1 hypothetical protein [Rubrivirga sp. F394]
MLAVHPALRYVTPLREGGSLPAVVETEAGAYVVKFRGAGQGARALVAEVVVGRLAQTLGLPLPDLALVDLAEAFGRSEPDPEIQDILRASTGLNVGLGFVEGAFPFDPLAAGDLVAPETAADVVWLDALTTNIDRTARNPNLLVAPGAGGPELWLIDHGAALYFHHDWASMSEDRARTPFPAIRDHVLLPFAGDIEAADARLAPLLTDAALGAVLDDVPDELLLHAPPGHPAPFASAGAGRRAYLDYFRARLAAPRAWVAEAVRAQAAGPDTTPLAYRR